MGMISVLKTTLSQGRTPFLLFAAISALALSAAFVAQYAYGLAPCVLCIYQRWPYAIIIALGLLGLYLAKTKPVFVKITLGLITLTFAANAAIAFYHTGVERKWWPSFLEGCSIPKIEGNITDVLAQIQTAPLVRCDEIPWTDPVIGLSMANYNVVLCLVLAIAAAYATFSRRTS